MLSLLFRHSNSPLVGHWKPLHSCCCVLLIHQTSFLEHRVAPDHWVFLSSSCFVPAQSLKSATSSRTPGSFYWRLVFLNQGLCAIVLISIGTSLPVGWLVDRIGNYLCTCVCAWALIHTCTHTSKAISTPTYLPFSFKSHFTLSPTILPSPFYASNSIFNSLNFISIIFDSFAYFLHLPVLYLPIFQHP